MPSLFDAFDDPVKLQALGLLGQGLMRRDFGAGAGAAMGLLAAEPERKLKRDYLEAQIAEQRAQADERRSKMLSEQEARAQAKRIQEILPTLYRAGAPMIAPGALRPAADGMGPMLNPEDVPQGRGGFDVPAAIRAGMPAKMIQEYAGLENLGRAKVARTVETMVNGKPTTIQLDEYGQPVGQGMEQWKAPVFQNLGGRTAAINPVTLTEAGSFAQSMSPEGRDASARGWAGNSIAQQRLAMDRETAQAGKVPAGYRPGPNGGLEFIPGGPADPAAARRAAPTEFQGKSGMFGARAGEADKIIQSLDGKFSPTAINMKNAAGGVWGVGGALEAGVNAAMSDGSQKAEQAQRDFVNAVLRLESGAAIGESEFANARKQYFPQPGDSQAVKAQKAANRRLAIQGLMDNSRPGGSIVQPQAAPSQGGATGEWGQTDDPLGLRR